MVRYLFSALVVIGLLCLLGCSNSSDPVSINANSEKTAYVPDEQNLHCITLDFHPAKFKDPNWLLNQYPNLYDAIKIALAPDGKPWVIDVYRTVKRLNANGWWMTLPGQAREIAIGKNGAVWIIGMDPRTGGYGIYYWNESTFNWVHTRRGGATKIAVTQDGIPWVITSGNDVFKSTDGGNNWSVIPNVKAREISINSWGVSGEEHKVVLTTTPQNSGYELSTWNNNTGCFESRGSWIMNGSGLFSPIRIAQAPEGLVYAISDNKIYRSAGDGSLGFSEIPGYALEIVCGGF